MDTNMRYSSRSKLNSSWHDRPESGAATLVFTIALLILSTLIVLFAANSGILMSKSAGNLNRNTQAFQAADAGLEFGINYLLKNSSTILANPSGGYISPYSDSSTTNVTLGNGSKFTVVYTNPVANNYNLILITSTGTCDDGSASRVVKQQVYLGSILAATPSSTVTSLGSVSISGNGSTDNLSGSTTIKSASTVSLGGNANTHNSAGVSSSAGNIRSDITQNASDLSGMTQDTYFASFFGTTSTASVQSQVANLYNNSSNTNYSSTLNGKTGTTIWINQTNGSTATINGTTTIGSASNPVLLVINGNLSISGNVTIYGFVFIIGTTGVSTFSGNMSIQGAIATSATLNISGNSDINLNSSILTKVQTNTGSSYYAKVAGSWKDF